MEGPFFPGGAGVKRWMRSLLEVTKLNRLAPGEPKELGNDFRRGTYLQ